MLDNMVGVLEEEQAEDDKKKAWCVAELDKAQSELKAAKAVVNDLSVQTDEAKDSIATVAAEIDELKAGLVAVELLGMAKNRMQKFYNPSLYKEPPKKAEDDSFEQLRARRPELGEAPEAFTQYRKAEGSAGVLAMMDEMIKETEMDSAEVKHDEEEAQKDYEELMKDSATKRADDSALIVTKEAEKAEKTSVLADLEEGLRTKGTEVLVLETKIEDTSKLCDPLIESYDAKREERAKEAEGIKSAKGVLEGLKM